MGTDKENIYDVYFLIGNFSGNVDYPVFGLDEIGKLKNEKKRAEKINVRKLLAYAIKKSFGYNAVELDFKISENGKPICDKLCFSLTHTENAAAVICSDKPCGIDAEYLPNFFNKCADKSFIGRFLNRIGENETLPEKEALRLWTVKESVYKAGGTGEFSPKNVSGKNDKTKSFFIGDYVLSVTCENTEKIKLNVLNF